ncbi:MAG TPA: hypothetical protein ENJ95_24665 [Bacteroidetes bacterium]|nr:hypothetical protein [Bacteroidota bacterium]
MEKYERFVLDDNDLIGKIAFAEFIKAYQKALDELEAKRIELEGKDMMIMADSMSSKEIVNTYKRDAANRLRDYTSLVINDYVDKTKREGFWPGVLQCLVAAAIWSLAILTIFYLNDEAVREYLKMLLGAG